eukprot:COSAG01_NODE_267_length_19843_cov_17.620948_5_plen_51_part_00
MPQVGARDTRVSVLQQHLRPGEGKDTLAALHRTCCVLGACKECKNAINAR